MIDIRTLLFANAVVFAVLAVAMILVWRENRRFSGLAYLARVHVAMIPGTVLVGLKPGLLPPFVTVVGGNALVVAGVAWLLLGIRALFGKPSGEARQVGLPLLCWLASLLFFLYIWPDLRARILTTSLVVVGFLALAAWTAGRGARNAEDRGPSLMIAASLGLLGSVFAARCVEVAVETRLSPLESDAVTITLVTVSLIAGTGWSLGVMNLVYARLNQEMQRSQESEVTERRLYEEALEQLVQVAAHELRTPLTSIVGTLKLLAAPTGVVSERDRERLLDVARRNSERMARLLDDLLDLERIESGQASLAIESVDVGRLLQQARELSEGHAQRHGVTVECEPGPHALVLADPQRLLQVVTNLLSNAIKFSPSGASVRVSSEQVNGLVRVEVKDLGPGIPDDFQPHIFQRFARGPIPSRTEGKGTGLGLAISKALVEGMGGRIGFETEERAGTTFFFELPAEG